MTSVPGVRTAGGVQRIVVLNNYSLEVTRAEVSGGSKPSHHLYGIDYFEQHGYEVTLVSGDSFPGWRRADRALRRVRFPIPLGDLAQQREALAVLRGRDDVIVYSPCQTQTQVLTYLRALRLLRAPIVNLAHHPICRRSGRLGFLRRPFARMFVRGTDSFPSLSSAVAREINELALDATKSRLVRWGPEVGFYPQRRGSGNGVIAAGRTGRDWKTFGSAASRTSCQATLVCLEHDKARYFAEFASNVRVLTEPSDDYMDYPELIPRYEAARVLGIPLLRGESLSGLTSLVDALGMGMPVIMTRHPLIDLDVEAKDIGIWVEDGDVDGWATAIDYFEEHPQRAREMGVRARRLADEDYNSLGFALEMHRVFLDVAAANSARARAGRTRKKRGRCR